MAYDSFGKLKKNHFLMIQIVMEKDEIKNAFFGIGKT